MRHKSLYFLCWMRKHTKMHKRSQSWRTDFRRGWRCIAGSPIFPSPQPPSFCRDPIHRVRWFITCFLFHQVFCLKHSLINHGRDESGPSRGRSMPGKGQWNHSTSFFHCFEPLFVKFGMTHVSGDHNHTIYLQCKLRRTATINGLAGFYHHNPIKKFETLLNNMDLEADL